MNKKHKKHKKLDASFFKILQDRKDILDRIDTEPNTLKKKALLQQIKKIDISVNKLSNRIEKSSLYTNIG